MRDHQRLLVVLCDHDRGRGPADLGPGSRHGRGVLGVRHEGFRVHSRYQRGLGDVAAAGHPVTIRLTVRRFLCPNGACAKVTFAEQIPELALKHSRRSVLLTRSLEAIGLALGGAGKRLAGVLSLEAGRTTLLRLVRALPEPDNPAPVLGVDDFALRRSQSYGTILVDMVTRRPVDLVSGRLCCLAILTTASPGQRAGYGFLERRMHQPGWHRSDGMGRRG